MEQAEKDWHKKFAIDTFNLTWDLMETKDKGQDEVDQMINAAHTSRYHWGLIGDATNIARGEWLISRMYATLNRAEPCLYHAERCLKITLENDLKDFDLAFAYEAMARACHIAEDEFETAKYMTLAEEAGADIQKEEDRTYFFSELHTINPGS
jgi:hypothetical protein